ncbi:MAG: hypothetical protein AAFY41_09900, partial [Bacteroidota bacterium]
ACHSYGIECKEVIINPGYSIKSHESWMPYLIALGEDFLRVSNSNILKEHLSNMSLSEIEILGDRELQIEIPHPTYPEFLVTIMGDSDLLEISIMHYMN